MHGEKKHNQFWVDKFGSFIVTYFMFCAIKLYHFRGADKKFIVCLQQNPRFSFIKEK